MLPIATVHNMDEQEDTSRIGNQEDSSPSIHNSLKKCEGSVELHSKGSITAYILKQKHDTTPTKEEDTNLQRGKNKHRHLTCLTPYRPVRQIYKVKSTETEEIKATCVDTKVIRKIWEQRVLSQLSTDTKHFIENRFDGKTTPKEKLVDFVDEAYNEQHRRDSLTRRKKRLFDLYYFESSNPDHIVHL